LGCGSVAESLTSMTSMCEALGLIPSIRKKVIKCSQET
jgi:hypothetical protein